MILESPVSYSILFLFHNHPALAMPVPVNAVWPELPLLPRTEPSSLPGSLRADEGPKICVPAQLSRPLANLLVYISEVPHTVANSPQCAPSGRTLFR